jgi:hypothetical protein
LADSSGLLGEHGWRYQGCQTSSGDRLSKVAHLLVNGNTGLKLGRYEMISGYSGGATTWDLL